MKRGDVWIASRLGHERKVVIVGNEGVTARRSGVIVVPISDVVAPGLIEPVVSSADGETLGVAQIPRVGEVSKAYLTTRAGALNAASAEMVDMALRVALSCDRRVSPWLP